MKQLKPADQKMESEITSLVEKITIGEVPEIQSTASSVTARLLNKSVAMVFTVFTLQNWSCITVNAMVVVNTNGFTTRL